jgi:hypothetical protein
MLMVLTYVVAVVWIVARTVVHTLLFDLLG